MNGNSFVNIGVLAIVSTVMVGMGGLVSEQSAQAGTIVLRPGPEGKDAGVCNSYGSEVNNGDSESILFGSYQGISNARAAVEFDLSSVPSGFPLTQATLTLTENEAWGAHHIYRAHLYRITESWDEATVTWNHRNATELWSTPGGSFAEEWASAVFTTQQGFQPIQFDVTALVQAWLNGTYPNCGFLIMPEVLYIDSGGSPTNNYAVFCTSDRLVEGYRPVLTLIPEPMTLGLLVLGSMAMLRRRR